METLEKYLNHYYAERGVDYMFIYKIIKENGKFGLLCHDIQMKPEQVWVYQDIPDVIDIMDNGLTFLESFIPELNPDCEAKELSEFEYFTLITEIEKAFKLQEDAKSNIIKFIKTNGLAKKV